MGTSISKSHNRIVHGWVKRALALLFTAAIFSVLIFPSYVTANAGANAGSNTGYSTSARSNTSARNSTGTGEGYNSNKVVRVGWYEAAYSYTDKFGRKTGIAYEYQQKISSYTGWEYEYVEGTWPELLTMLMKGEIDLLSDVSYTAERAKSILYPSLPMGTESYYIYISSDNLELMDEHVFAFNGKTFAVNRGSIQEKFLKDWAKDNNISIKIKEIIDLSADETIDLLRKGEVDAYVSLDTYGKDDGCTPVYKIGASDYFFAVCNSRPDLLSELDHALISIQNEDPFYNQRLYQKYIWSYNTGIMFTKEEREWASAHNTIKVGYRDNYPPFCYQENGELSGALKDYLEYASTSIEGMRINYEAIAYPTTEDAIVALNNGEIDAVFPVSMSAYDSEVSDMYVTTPVMSAEIYALVRTGEEKDVLTADDTKVVLLTGNVNFDNFVKDYFPDWEIMWDSPLEKVYEDVADGKADCAMVNGYRITTNDRLRRKYELSLIDTGEEMEFSFAVKRENGMLFSIMDKTAGLVEEAAVDTMLSRYNNPITKVSFYDYLQDNWAVAVAVAAVIVSLILFLLLTGVKSDQKATERQKLISATELDLLTGLYTRNFFFAYANRMYKENPDYRMDAIVTNIEQFHVINALYGWDFGDTILKALGEEISAYIGGTDGIACRSQADRFDIYVVHTDDYEGLYERLQGKLDEVSQNVSIRLRMGVMPWQKDLGPVQLFDRARAACSMIRGAQIKRLMVFSEEMREREILEQRLLGDLRYALDNNEFTIFYQPKFKVQVDPPKLWSAEALVRWNHHELGMIPPGEFITLFEKSGQIEQLDKYVWNEAARQIAEWEEKYGVIIPVSVNLSRVEIFDPDIENIIDGIVEEHGIGRENLHLEITESAYTEGEEKILEVIESFRRKGYHIEMDDFGTGYSSLNLLSHMSIDVLKLDRSFIKDIVGEDSESKNVRMVELILDIAKSLRLVVVAEGVETKEQVEFLKKRGCDLIQGYYFSKPLPAEEFEKKAF